MLLDFVNAVFDAARRSKQFIKVILIGRMVAGNDIAGIAVGVDITPLSTSKTRGADVG